MQISKLLKMLDGVCKSGDQTLIEEMILRLELPLEEVSDMVYNEEYDMDDDTPYKEDLRVLLEILKYIYDNTTLPEPISNDLYDKLHEKYVGITGSSIVGTNINIGNKKTCTHRFPHLRGSLDKVHYLSNSDIPKGDSRKSLEGWIQKCLRGTNKGVLLLSRFKYDGVSLVFEFDKYKNLEKVLTRGDTDLNLGQDVTEIFIDYTFDELFGDMLHSINFTDVFAVKTECLMTFDNFKQYNEDKGLSLKNTRSAIISFINSEDNTYEDLKYITLEVLEISSKGKPEYDEDKLDCVLVEVDSQNGFTNYIVYDRDTDNNVFRITENCLEFESDDTKERLDVFIEGIRRLSEEDMVEPIDGIVFSIFDKDIVSKMGRKDNINKFQIAFKFPAGISKAIVKNVRFQVGVMGGITPVIEFNPIKVMGATLENTSPGSINKLKNLDINIGDEIIIKYDIIPVVMKDETCIKGTGPKIIPPTTCPMCGDELSNTGFNVFCGNDDCDSRIVGKIINYTNKLDIKHIGVETISALYNLGFLTNIADLYRLPDKLGAIVQIKGFKEPMMRKIFGSIFSKTNLFPHEFLGSLGIPTIGRKVMENVCTKIPFSRLLLGYNDNYLLPDLCNIKGIADKTAKKILDGISKNDSLINDLLTYINIMPYEVKQKEKQYTQTVLFSNVKRDKDFEQYLDDNDIKVVDSYSSKVDVVITADLNGTTSKLKKAKADNKSILSIGEAKERYGYV